MYRPGDLIQLVPIILVLGLWTSWPAHAAAPVARDDSVVATDRYLEIVDGVETYSILIDVLANDEDADGDPLEVVVTGDFGGPPWIATPVGTVSYLGGGVFELSFGKEALGDATQVTFQYELEGAVSAATVRVTVAGEGPAPEVIARDDAFGAGRAGSTCWLRLPVLANDTGLDRIDGFTQPSGGIVEVHPADPQVLVYRGGGSGQFTYVAKNSVTGATASATVSILVNIVASGDETGETGSTQMADCFSRKDDTALGDEPVAFFESFTDPAAIPWPAWTAGGLAHLERSITVDAALPGGTPTQRKAYLAFDADAWLSLSERSAFKIDGTFRATPDEAEWVALAFTHGTGSVLTEADLWVQLDVETGELILNGRWNGADLQEHLGSANPADDGYPFVRGGVNHLSLRYDTAPTVPKVDVWMNGVRVFSRVGHADVTGSIENVGFALDYGQSASGPGDAWFDDFELWTGDVHEARLLPKSGHPDLGTDVANGSTLDLGPLHVGCTPEHAECHPSREMSIWLTNDGNRTLEVSHLELQGPTDWTLVTPSVDSFSILPGAAEEILVRVDALEVGTSSSRLELSTSDPDTPKLTVDLTARTTQAPLADFVHYCSGLVCSFDAGPSTGVGLNQFSYFWFVDGVSQSFGPTLDRTFSGSGVHAVAVQVADATGAQHRVERAVGIAPRAAFTYVCDQTTRTCDFDGAATTEGAVGFDYEFGDGTAWNGTGDPGSVVVLHTYATSGRYDVRLTVRDGDGQEGTATHEVMLAPRADFAFTCSPETLACEFDASASTPGMVLYEWSFGDGTRATGLQTAHAYETSGVYTVTLVVVDPAGQVETISKPVAVPPRAAFSTDCDPDLRACTFDGSASSPGVTHAWTFGDGSPEATGPVQAHTYSTSGIFTVTLTVTDASGQTASESRPVVLPPRAELSVDCDGLSCRFDASGSSPGITLYAWDFGHPGGTDTGVAPLHEFPDAGDYDVSLTVTDGSGQTATSTRRVSVGNDELFLLILLDRASR